MATVPDPCKLNGGRCGVGGGQLSLSLAGPMEAIKTSDGNCPCALHVQSKAQLVLEHN